MASQIQRHSPCKISRTIRIVWGVAAIARAIGRTERSVYPLVETGQLPGAKRIGGKWGLDLDRFHAVFDDSAAA
jgi:hypothetical protein